MMWVRFPNGQRIVYNKANFLAHGNGEYILRERENGTPIAFIQESAGAIVEFTEACHVSNPIDEQHNYRIEEIAKDVRILKRRIPAQKTKAKKK